MEAYFKLKYFFVLLLFFSFNTTINAQYKEGVLRVKLKETKAEFVRSARMTKSVKGNPVIGDKKLDAAMAKCNAFDMKRVFRSAGAFEAKHRKHGLHLWYEVTFDKSVDIIEALAAFKGIEDVITTEPLHQKKQIGGAITKIEAASLAIPTNDTFYDYQWHYENTGNNLGDGAGGTPDADIDLPEAWAIQTGIPEVVVAVIDGGIDITHQDLSANMWINTGEIPNNNIDDDRNGYVDDVNGYGFGDSSGFINASDHGTHVGGTVAAVSNNNTGVSGIAGGNGSGDGVRLMSCSVFGNTNADGFDESFIYAADMGAVIAQNSWGYTSQGIFEQSVLDAIDYFIEEAGYDANGNPVGPMQGGIVIFAAGNDGADGEFYPGYYDAVMAVGSTDLNDAASSFSNRGNWVDIAAPGSTIVSTYPGNSYGYNSGTSMACPHVSGVAALIVSEYAGNITPGEVWSRLVDSADPLPFNFLGSGRLNAFAALDGGNVSEPEFPDVTKTYYIDNRNWNVRLGADGSQDAFTTSVNTTGANVEWKISPAPVEGYFYIDCVGGGAVPRLRSDQSILADMQSTGSQGTWARWMFTDVGDGYFYLTTQNDSEFDRLQVDASGEVRTVASNFTGNWTHFKFTEVGTSTNALTIIDNPELSVFPNPVVNYLNVTSTNKIAYNSLEIHDFSGNVVSTQAINASAALKVDVTDLKEGIHFLRLLKNDGTIEVVRFVK